jgi:putative sigma-54 modulation protein
MNIEYIGRNYQIEDRVRTFTEDKLRKATKFLDEPIDVRVTLELERHRHIAELHLTHRHGLVQATEETSQMLDAINMAVDKVEKQARRARKKHMARRRRSQRGADNGQQWPVDIVEPSSLRGGAKPRIIKSSLLPIKPMSIEEAALQLQESEHDFVVFRDSETAQINVLYKRKDRNYGLISPTF